MCWAWEPWPRKALPPPWVRRASVQCPSDLRVTWVICEGRAQAPCRPQVRPELSLSLPTASTVQRDVQA